MLYDLHWHIRQFGRLANDLALFVPLDPHFRARSARRDAFRAGRQHRGGDKGCVGGHE